jgi:hypothetical protein
MIYLKYLIFIIIEKLADILNLFAAPFVAPFASEAGWLPWYLSAFGTPDNTLDGDEGWKNEHRPFKVEDTKKKRWWNRTRWMHRNSMYGLAIDVLGYKFQPGDVLEVTGNPAVSNRPLLNGLVIRKVRRDGKVVAFQWYYVRAWTKTKCLRVNIGWKLWAFPGRCQVVFSVNPVMGYSLI